jgi:3-methyladenine DNA glycosylase AlkC
MADAFKHLIHTGTIEQAARHLQRAWPAFDARAFRRQASAGLEALEMKARAMQIADALQAHLPAEFAQAAAVVEASLAPPIEPEAPASADSGDAGLAGWVVWSLGEWVARQASAEPARLARALQCLHALTQRFSAEFAIRPLLRDHPEAVLATLMAWTGDPSAHVRRLASEGSRPRLPWGLRLQALVDDPRPTLPLLLALQDDPSEYVRRSVANHLNDIAKDHPGLVADWLHTHLPGASAERRALLRHASRTLIKQGDARVLQAWGVGGGLQGRATLSLGPAQLQLGQTLQLSLSLQSASRQPQALVVDYAVHHVKANGSTSPKVFKGWTLTLAPGEHRTLLKPHAVKPITTRRYHPGWHRLTVQVNGQTVAEGGFELRL